MSAADLTPDQLHEEYYRTHPHGNHPFPAPETRAFMEQQLKLNEKIVDKLEKIEVLNAHQTEIMKRVEAQTTKTNGRVTKLEEEKQKFDVEYAEFLEELKEERKDTRSRFKDMAWEIVRTGVIAVLSGMAAVLGVDKFLK